MDGLLLALTHVISKPYDIGAAELLLSEVSNPRCPAAPRHMQMYVPTGCPALRHEWGHHRPRKDQAPRKRN